MATKKDEAIQTILNDFEAMANLVLHQLDLLEGVISSKELNLPEEIADQIEANEQRLDKLEIKLSEKIVNTIVLYQPVASDIRKIIACYRMVISLERIGDLVLNITRFMKKIKSQQIYDSLADAVSNMYMLSVNMVKRAIISFINEDKDLAIWTIKNDSEVGEVNQKMLKKAISSSLIDHEKKNILISFINIKEMISNIERIADHSANIAEAAIYSFEGKDVRHHRLDE